MLQKPILCALFLFLGTPRHLAQIQPAQPAPPQDDSITTPFAVLTAPTSWIPVRVKINGKGPYLFILDSGAEINLITPELAAELGVVPNHRVNLGADTQKMVRAGELIWKPSNSAASPLCKSLPLCRRSL